VIGRCVNPQNFWRIEPVDNHGLGQFSRVDPNPSVKLRNACVAVVDSLGTPPSTGSIRERLAMSVSV
jgi:hypothetical protein